MKPTPIQTRAYQVLTAMVMGTALTTLCLSEAAASTGPENKAVEDISRYCQVCWRNARLHPDSWADCTQEVIVRLLQTVKPDRWQSLLKDETPERKEFLRAIDAVKKRTQRARKFTGMVSEMADQRSHPEATRNELREELNLAARKTLSPRQQKIISLTCEGWSIPEIASELTMSVDRVSDEKYKAIQKLRRVIHKETHPEFPA